MAITKKWARAYRNAIKLAREEVALFGTSDGGSRVIGVWRMNISSMEMARAMDVYSYTYNKEIAKLENSMSPKKWRKLVEANRYWRMSSSEREAFNRGRESITA